MPEDEGSGGIVIILPDELIAETKLPGQVKESTFKIRNLDYFEVV